MLNITYILSYFRVFISSLFLWISNWLIKFCGKLYGTTIINNSQNLLTCFDKSALCVNTVKIEKKMLESSTITYTGALRLYTCVCENTRRTEYAGTKQHYSIHCLVFQKLEHTRDRQLTSERRKSQTFLHITSIHLYILR